MVPQSHTRATFGRAADGRGGGTDGDLVAVVGRVVHVSGRIQADLAQVVPADAAEVVTLVLPRTDQVRLQQVEFLLHCRRGGFLRRWMGRSVRRVSYSWMVKGGAWRG